MAIRWLAFYTCKYCHKSYKALNIAQCQLGLCPNCLNYNTPEIAVRKYSLGLLDYKHQHVLSQNFWHLTAVHGQFEQSYKMRCFCVTKSIRIFNSNHRIFDKDFWMFPWQFIEIGSVLRIISFSSWFQCNQLQVNYQVSLLFFHSYYKTKQIKRLALKYHRWQFLHMRPITAIKSQYSSMIQQFIATLANNFASSIH